MPASVVRQTILALTEHPAVADLVHTHRLVQPVVRRFVAGERLDDALRVTGALNRDGLAVALDYLGENTTTAAEAAAATHEALAALDGIHSHGARAYLSVKLTQLGLDLGEYLVLHSARQVLERARRHGLFVRVDMEGSSFTARTLELCTALHREFPQLGVVIQAYLYRSEADLHALVQQGIQVRLVKGAYAEPPHIAFRRKRDTDRNYQRLMAYLLRQGTYPAIATHDPRIIDEAVRVAAQVGRAARDFEFQMLFGVRRDLQRALVEAGYGVRVYVPYGRQWYPYLTRRIAERPANLLFMAGSLAREGKARRIR
jgi:proline dehydrogenase